MALLDFTEAFESGAVGMLDISGALHPSIYDRIDADAKSIHSSYQEVIERYGASQAGYFIGHLVQFGDRLDDEEIEQYRGDEQQLARIAQMISPFQMVNL